MVAIEHRPFDLDELTAPARVPYREAKRRVEEHGFWYHTIDVLPGITTPGYFDLRHSLPMLPWPDVEGKRCLDIATWDGFYAFELERRGAAEVVAIDIPSPTLWDWPADSRPSIVGPRDLSYLGPPKHEGFQLIAELRDSKVKWQAMSIYDLEPDVIGTFDVVVLGSLLLHLRDPIRALEAVRSVCDGWLLSSEQIELGSTLFRRGRPRLRFDGSGDTLQWAVPNAAGYQRMVWSAGFDVEERTRPYMVRFNRHPRTPMSGREALRRIGTRALTGDPHPGVLHQAMLARPRV
jgi:tRNA (mo5U34)-methyltransferase